MSSGHPPMKQMALDIGLAPVPTLDNFVAVGNEAALAHLRLWAGNPLRSPVPTFLWGEGGSGKTHLLQAVRCLLAFCARLREGLRKQFGLFALAGLDVLVHQAQLFSQFFGHKTLLHLRGNQLLKTVQHLLLKLRLFLRIGKAEFSVDCPQHGEGNKQHDQQDWHSPQQSVFHSRLHALFALD